MQDRDLEFVVPPIVVMTFEGVTLRITPLTVNETLALIPFVESMLDELMQLDDGAIDRLRRKLVSRDEISALLGLVRAQGPQLFAAVAACCRQPVEWVEGLLADRFFAVLAACVEVNRDFFSDAMPAIGAAMRKLGPARLRGPTPSSSSSPTATDTTTSAATPSASSAAT